MAGHNRFARNSAGRRPRIVYMLVNPFTNKPFYIGCTTSPKQRLREHHASFDATGRRAIIEAIRNAGAKVIMVQLDVRYSPGETLNAETFWIETFLRSGTLLVNREAPDSVRKEALRENLEACNVGDGASVLLAVAPADPIMPAAPPPIELPPPRVAEPRSVPADRPTRHSRPWSDSEVTILCKRFMIDGLTLPQLAQQHQRSELAILSKLKAQWRETNSIQERMVALGLVTPDGEIVRPFDQKSEAGL